MGVSLLLFICLTLGGGLPAHTARLFVELSPAKTVSSAVSLIDQKYLHAKTNRAWQQAKRTLLEGRYQSAAQAYQALAEQLASVHDPELYLLNSDEFRTRQEELEARRVGTGLTYFAIDRDPTTGDARVVTALGDSPAARAGIRPRDVIVSIDGRPTRQMSHEAVLDALAARGESKMRLVIRRGNHKRKVTLEASSQPLNAVQYSRKKIGGKTIGYIRVLLFTPNAGYQVQNAVSELERQGVDGYVLDLRNNPGGLLDSAEHAASGFTSGVLGTKVTERGAAERLVTRGAPLTGKPLVVLINGGTASAAEVLAGALHDLRRAVLVGSPSFGRGQTQAYFPLSDGYGVVVPTAEIRTPDGRSFKPLGLRPDLQIGGDLLPARKIATRHDAQFQRAIAVLLHS
jgi:carboxyl-terminal processing protease